MSIQYLVGGLLNGLQQGIGDALNGVQGALSMTGILDGVLYNASLEDLENASKNTLLPADVVAKTEEHLKKKFGDNYKNKITSMNEYGARNTIMSAAFKALNDLIKESGSQKRARPYWDLIEAGGSYTVAAQLYVNYMSPQKEAPKDAQKEAKQNYVNPIEGH